jgi:hypothetical protein
MNVPPFIEFMCGMVPYSSSHENTATTTKTTTTTLNSIDDTVDLKQEEKEQEQEINKISASSTENTHHHYLQYNTTDNEEWSLFDFTSHPPLCCTDSTMDTIFRLPNNNNMGDVLEEEPDVPQVSRGMSLLKTDEEDDDDDDDDEGEEQETKGANPKERSEEVSNEGSLGIKTSSPRAWYPPIYRNMTLHSVPSRAGEQDGGHHHLHHHQGPTIIPNDVSAASSPASVPRRRASSVYGDDDDDIEPLPIDFIPPRHEFSRSINGKEEEDCGLDATMSPGTAMSLFSDMSLSKVSALNKSSSFPCDFKRTSSNNNHDYFMELHPQDVICGRGQPTQTHPGNFAFKAVIQQHEMSYLCARRSEKPKIAWSLLDEFRAQGIRFVKREKLAVVLGNDQKHASRINTNDKGQPKVSRKATTKESDDDSDDEGWVWVDIGDSRAYAKITQALREEAPQLRRQLLVSTQTMRSSKAIQNGQKSTPKSRTKDSLEQQQQPSDKKKQKKSRKAATESKLQTYDPVANKKKRIGEARDERNAAIVGGQYDDDSLCRAQPTVIMTTPQRTLFPSSPSSPSFYTSSCSASMTVTHHHPDHRHHHHSSMSPPYYHSYYQTDTSNLFNDHHQPYYSHHQMVKGTSTWPPYDINSYGESTAQSSNSSSSSSNTSSSPFFNRGGGKRTCH